MDGGRQTLYYYEIQLDWAPGCSVLRSPHGRASWRTAWDEGRVWAEAAARRGERVLVGVVGVAVDEGA